MWGRARIGIREGTGGRVEMHPFCDPGWQVTWKRIDSPATACLAIYCVENSRARGVRGGERTRVDEWARRLTVDGGGTARARARESAPRRGSHLADRLARHRNGPDHPITRVEEWVTGTGSRAPTRHRKDAAKTDAGSRPCRTFRGRRVVWHGYRVSGVHATSNTGASPRRNSASSHKLTRGLR